MSNEEPLTQEQMDRAAQLLEAEARRFNPVPPDADQLYARQRGKPKAGSPAEVEQALRRLLWRDLVAGRVCSCRNSQDQCAGCAACLALGFGHYQSLPWLEEQLQR